MDLLARIKPRRLCPGATLGIIAPASPGNRETAAAGIHWLKEQGFQVRLGLTVNQEEGYLAGADTARAADLNAMFASPDIDGIICLRGGYGTMRLLDLLDYDLIKAHPKIFVGYSDITALHTSIGQRTGLVTFHGPMAAADMGKTIPDYTWNYFWRAVTSPEPLGLLVNPPQAPAPQFIVPGSAEGCLTGGNLSLIAATMGTAYEIDTYDKILCLEDVGEAPYRLDRMLTQLLLAGKLQAAAGIVVDVFADCEEEATPPSFTVEEVLRNRLGGLNKPVLMNLYFGHTADKVTLPLGIKATLRSQDGGLAVVETATLE
ncbi:S66 peptidase family protein [Sporomusa acidovorans]|uniref:Murein peptide carboxypeptidase n=1 Tax=Sporomusa acidovorans (strain ATCC 49682 / DSM 3132 / Mol) TaxID=1123286 RepID=A0ABZ3JA60_SPOA4|nr:LD-carboxypeptidase [Sporomusa acidovorans]OZC16101.1 putative murein peptide carboxypeptidase [Sporomusa acidovorans DSM 3132]SDD86692.1 muramoyltetrapeptide carboxypeptidase [Sporomusa acidovorans]